MSRPTSTTVQTTDKTGERSTMRIAKGIAAGMAILMMLLMPSGTGIQADVNNNGLDELFVFGREVDGSARGPWYQIWDGTGALVASQFILDGFTDFQFHSADVDGAGGDELVVLAVRETDGAAIVQVRASGGAVIASKVVAGGNSTRHQLFPIELSGFAGTEIGVGFQVATSGAGVFQVWRISGANLVQVQAKTLTGGAFGRHQWRAGDFDADGSQDVFAGYQRSSDDTSAFSVWDVADNTSLGTGFVSGPAFDDHQWLVADFISGGGDEFFAGFVRKSDGAAVYQVRNEANTLLGSTFVTSGVFGDHEWVPLNTANDCCPEVLHGFVRRSDRAAAFQVIDFPNSIVASTFVSGSALTPAGWDAGNFDGNPNTGQEVLYGFIRESDGAIGYKTYSNAASVIGGTFALGGAGDFVAPQFQAIEGFFAGRDDVLIGARKLGGSPLLQARVHTGPLLFSQFVLNSNVKIDAMTSD